MADRLASLDRHERRCLELAWDACAAGTIGVGSVLVDVAGEVVAQGNNGLFAAAGKGPLSGSPVAHAEMNVIAQVRPGLNYSDHTLYTSLEPCPMCAGAIVLLGVEEVRVIAPDHLMHDLDAMADRNDWVRDHWAPRTFCDNRDAVDLATLFATHVVAFFRGGDHPSIQKLRDTDPELADRIGKVVESRRLVELSKAEARLAEVVFALDKFFR